jgi:rhamnogalacturonyl hydrolase YesR
MNRPFAAATGTAIALFILFMPTVAFAQTTQPQLPDRNAVIAIMRKTADYQLEQNRLDREKKAAAAAATKPTTLPATKPTTKPAATTRKTRTRRPVKAPPPPSTTAVYQEADNDWVRATFFPGVMALHETTKDSKYRDAAVAWGELFKWTPPGDQRMADRLACGQTYCELFMLERDPRMITPFREAVDRMIATKKPGRADWWWCDSLFMAPPALVRLSRASGDPKYTAFMNEMYWDAADYLYDVEENLFYRDRTFLPMRETKNGEKIFWARGNGWVMGGIARVLQFLPANDPNRARFVKLHQDMSARLLDLQDADGCWRSSLLDPEEFPQPETSGTAFFCFAYAWGINNGTLDRARYLPATMKAWNGLVAKVTKDGKLGYVQKVAAGPGEVKPEDTHEYAVGAFLLAGCEIVKLIDAR